MSWGFIWWAAIGVLSAILAVSSLAYEQWAWVLVGVGATLASMYLAASSVED